MVSLLFSINYRDILTIGYFYLQIMQHVVRVNGGVYKIFHSFKKSNSVIVIHIPISKI